MNLVAILHEIGLEGIARRAGGNDRLERVLHEQQGQSGAGFIPLSYFRISDGASIRPPILYRKTVILNLTMMEPDQAQRAVDFVAGGTFAIDGHQERVGESIFLFAPSCVTVTNASQDESTTPTVVTKDVEQASAESSVAPAPAWAVSDAAAL